MYKIQDLSSNTFTDTMVRQSIVLFIESRLWNSRGSNHTNIICNPMQDHQLGSPSHKEYYGGSFICSQAWCATISCCLSSLLFLTIRCNWRLIDKMYDARHGPTSDKVILEVGILIRRSSHKPTSRCGHVRRKFLFNIPTDGKTPIVQNRSSNLYMIENLSSKSGCTCWSMFQITTHLFKAIKVSLTWCNTKTGHSSNT
jgi:hypothetical protein